MDNIKNYFGIERNEEELTFQERHCPTLSWSQRLIGFIGCLTLAVLFIFLSITMIINPRSFGKFYTLGSMFLIASSFFLVGPATQIKNLFHSSRIVSAFVYIISLVLTLYCAVSLQSKTLTLLCSIIQVCASIWYGASYIPYAQDLLKMTAGNMLPL